MNKCFLPTDSSIKELVSEFGKGIEKVQFFHERIEKHVDILLGSTYVLPDVLKSFKDFSEALAPLINPELSFGYGQLRDKDMTNKFDIYDKYFEVSRINKMTSGQFIQQYLDTSAELINEFQYTSMSRGEIAYILKAWEAANLILLRGQKNLNPNFTLEKESKEAAPQDNSDRALYRWKLAHHGFAIFMIFSSHCFEQATKLIEARNYNEELEDWLDKGAHLFRATTGCMEFGNSFTANIYRSVVRPDMSRANEEANLPNGFSGTQNLEFVKWRKAKNDLFVSVREKINELPESVREKFELFRTYYLEDMHIHSIIAGRMVGIEKSLLQEGFGSKKGKAMKITAGDMLRMMAKAREKEVEFLK